MRLFVLIAIFVGVMVSAVIMTTAFSSATTNMCKGEVVDDNWICTSK